MTSWELIIGIYNKSYFRGEHETRKIEEDVKKDG